MKRPEDCTNIDDIRNEIDAVDKHVIELLGKRLQYVKEIVRFKKDEEDILARKRYREVLLTRREWASEQGLSPDIIENMYIMLIQFFIEVQKKTLKAKQASQKRNQPDPIA